MEQHSGFQIGVIISAFISFVIVAIINALSAQGPVAGVFNSNQMSLSAKYDTGLTPAGWTFSIWGVIYTWQALHLVYSLTLICRRVSGIRLFQTPDPVGSSITGGPVGLPFYICYIISGAMNIGWIFSFDREVLVAACVFLFLIPISLYAALIVSHRHFYSVAGFLQNSGQVKDVWLTRMLVHNGVAFYCAWTNVAAMLNLTIMMHYVYQVSMDVCVWISFGLLNAVVLFVFILEIFVFDKYLRYTFAHYITLVVAFSGILYQNYSPDVANMKYAIVLLALSATLGVIKVIVMIIRGIRSPIQYPNCGFDKDAVLASSETSVDVAFHYSKSHPN